MVSIDPAESTSRQAKEALIRVIDLVIYVGILICGVFAFVATPATVTKELAGFEWLIVPWATLLVLGGLLGFAGRISRIWALELPGTGAGIFGCFIYTVVLFKVATGNILVGVAVVLIAIATLTLIRRYIELQIFTSEPNSGSFLSRLRAALRRRTENAVPRQR